MEKLQQNARLESHFSVGFWLIRLMCKTKWILECPCDYAFSICARVVVKGSRRGCVNVKVVILIGENKVLNRDRVRKEPEAPLCPNEARKGALTSLLFLAAPRRSDCLQLQRRRSFAPLTPADAPLDLRPERSAFPSTLERRRRADWRDGSVISFLTLSCPIMASQLCQSFCTDWTGI